MDQTKIETLKNAGVLTMLAASLAVGASPFIFFYKEVLARNEFNTYDSRADNEVPCPDYVTHSWKKVLQATTKIEDDLIDYCSEKLSEKLPGNRRWTTTPMESLGFDLRTQLSQELTAQGLEFTIHRAQVQCGRLTTFGSNVKLYLNLEYNPGEKK
ncbi:hypothetical protein HYV86_02815 [Candidatus Woesearchaeota archaeon]|nr:hypothetical protein [Candidatus Woesearchaeota archaeon]